MALATLDNVTASVGAGTHNVSLSIEEDGLVVGPFGKLPWAGSEMAAQVGGEGCTIHLFSSPGVDTRYFIPSSSFASFGGTRVMKSFMQSLLRAASSAGARVVA